MRRSDRLFQIIQILRRASRKPTTALELSEELEISTRTVYRDIADLMAQRVPIRGEAGMGYVLDSGFDMPPLMLTSEEVEAALLGAQWVSSQGDAQLANSAKDLIAKIAAVIPDQMQSIILEPITMTPNMSESVQDTVDMPALRNAIRNLLKLKIDYMDLKDRITTRTIWPIAIAYFESAKLIIAWCELRKGYRHFRSDRIKSWDVLTETFQGPISRLRHDWWQEEKQKYIN